MTPTVGLSLNYCTNVHPRFHRRTTAPKKQENCGALARPGAGRLTDGATAADVGRLLAEVEAAANAAGTAAQEAQTRALDLLLPRDAVTVARREMDDASFTRDRLSEAARRLGERLNELRALEKARAQRAEHERVQAERDRLAAEMERMGEPIAEIARLVAEIDACDREIRNLNATTGLALGYIRPALAGWVKAQITRSPTIGGSS